MIEKHKDLLNVGAGTKKIVLVLNSYELFPAKINSGILDSNGNIIPMTASIYVNDILTAGAFQDKMLKLLAAIVEAIFWSLEFLISWSVSVLGC